MDIGQRKDALVVTERKGQRMTMRCDCGKDVTVYMSMIDRFSSCGCKIHLVGLPKVHDHPHYARWNLIKDRCENPDSKAWHNYGGRGITMCKTWRHDYKQFCKDIGDPPSKKHEIDRIDNDGNYEPGNIRWGLRVVNQRNQRRSCFLHWNGVEIPIWEACVTFGTDYFCTHGAYRRGNGKLINYLRRKGATDAQFNELAETFRDSATGRVTQWVR